MHTWCGAHGLRHLRGLYEFDPGGQVWARSMADLLIWASNQVIAAKWHIDALEALALRDSEDPYGPVLVVTPEDWQAFTATVKAGALGLR